MAGLGSMDKTVGEMPYRGRADVCASCYPVMRAKLVLEEILPRKVRCFSARQRHGTSRQKKMMGKRDENRDKAGF
jgi:hypothetical protein